MILDNDDLIAQDFENALDDTSIPHTQNLADIKAHFATIAKNSQQKRPIHINVSVGILNRLKAKALQEGMPYQILINHILHKYIQGEMIPVYA